MQKSTVYSVFVWISIISSVHCHDDGRYEPEERIPLYADTVYPYHNPQESYRYYNLHFCRPDPMKHKSQTLGEILQGSEKVYSPYKISFKKNESDKILCTLDLLKEDIEAFRYAIQNNYHFTWWFDDLAIKGVIGYMDHHDNCFLYTHHDFKFSYNGDRIIEAKVASDPSAFTKLDPSANIEVSFTYSVKWDETGVQWEDRGETNYEEDVIDIQWFSIVNSFVLVMLLTLFLVFMVMRILKRDVQRYIDEEETDETGWKLLHADVFRFPKHKCLFAAILGTGVQLLLLFVIMLTLSVFGVFSQYGRGTMYAAILIVYSLVAVIAGYTSSSFYRKIDGDNWVQNVLATVTLFAGPAFILWSIMNTIAWIWHSTVALPFGTIVALFALYLLVTLPLTLAGAIAGKNYGGVLDTPTKTRLAPREIPQPPWYRGWAMHLAVAGFLPFSAIYVELYYVFMSLWGHQLFTPYGILYLVFVILLLVTACITVSLTYLQLSMEDHNWWWRALISGGSTSFFIYAYCFYFLWSESQMSGFMQLSYYFGYMLLIVYALFLMLGAVGFFASLSFVTYIYKAVKCE